MSISTIFNSISHVPLKICMVLALTYSILGSRTVRLAKEPGVCTRTISVQSEDFSVSLSAQKR